MPPTPGFTSVGDGLQAGDMNREHKNGLSVKKISDLAESKSVKPVNRKLIGIDGCWYDVTDFIHLHPGGPVIEHFIGKDATDVFHAYGHSGVLKHRKPVGTYSVEERHPADADFVALKNYFEQRGFFKTDYSYYVKKALVVLGLFATVWLLVTQSSQWYMHYLGGLVLAFFWQQCGFIMHDFMHTQVLRDRARDSYGGLLFGTVCFGISAHWWQDEHIFHHAMTNVVDSKKTFADPQMWESAWAQNTKLFPLFKAPDQKLFSVLKSWLQYYLIKIQHITFVPVVTMVGRFEIVTDSFRRERRPSEWFAWAFHWLWLVPLLSCLPTWKERVIFYCIGAWVEGIFHFQLILSHYCKMHMTAQEFHKSSWFEYQILSNLNLDSPTWLDWYYGGLNFHIEHHLFPTMARKHLREAAGHVRKVCAKHDIPYDQCSFTMALWTTLKHLKTTSQHYTLDPR